MYCAAVQTSRCRPELLLFAWNSDWYPRKQPNTGSVYRLSVLCTEISNILFLGKAVSRKRSSFFAVWQSTQRQQLPSMIKIKEQFFSRKQWRKVLNICINIQKWIMDFWFFATVRCFLFAATLVFLFAAVRFFLFATHCVFLLHFALSLRGFGQITAQFTSIWTTPISVEQLAICPPQVGIWAKVAGIL